LVTVSALPDDSQSSDASLVTLEKSSTPTDGRRLARASLSRVVPASASRSTGAMNR
jgi:hypothetical protein